MIFGIYEISYEVWNGLEGLNWIPVSLIWRGSSVSRAVQRILFNISQHKSILRIVKVFVKIKGLKSCGNSF